MIYSKEDILNQLIEMHAPKGSVVLIHSSLRAIGETEGRGEGLLDAFIEYFTADNGLLCIPTHTWDKIADENSITLDLMNPSTCIGTLPNIAAKHQDAVRSLHPTHSMAVFGDTQLVNDFVSNESYLTTPASPCGCYGKIFDKNGYILLIGVEHNRNTFLHCVEEMIGISNRIARTPKNATIRHVDGRIEKQIMHPHEAVGIGDVSLRYVKYERAFRYHGCIIDGKIGNAPAQLCNARKMKEVMELIYKRSGGIELMQDYEPLNEEYYK